MNKYDKHRRKQGKWEEVDRATNIKTVSNYVNDILEGEQYGYYETGELYYIVNYKRGMLNGLSTYYKKPGGVDFTYNYKDGDLIPEKKTTTKLFLIINTLYRFIYAKFK